MYTIGRLARRVGLSRSTLLYYDRIGVLCPSGRSESNYRLYTEEDRVRLAAICRYRDAGLSLSDIGALLDGPEPGDRVSMLTQRLDELSREIARCRDQQRVIVRLLEQRESIETVRVLDKRAWVSLLKAAGLDSDDMDTWHIEFERMAPEAHEEFLRGLGIADDEIAAIRASARAAQNR